MRGQESEWWVRVYSAISSHLVLEGEKKSLGSFVARRQLENWERKTVGVIFNLKPAPALNRATHAQIRLLLALTMSAECRSPSEHQHIPRKMLEKFPKQSLDQHHYHRHHRIFGFVFSVADRSPITLPIHRSRDRSETLNRSGCEYVKDAGFSTWRTPTERGTTGRYKSRTSPPPSRAFCLSPFPFSSLWAGPAGRSLFYISIHRPNWAGPSPHLRRSYRPSGNIKDLTTCFGPNQTYIFDRTWQTNFQMSSFSFFFFLFYLNRTNKKETFFERYDFDIQSQMLFFVFHQCD